jgi:hypothetical protein
MLSHFFRTKSISIGRLAVLLGAITLIVGMLLPWFQTNQPLYGVTAKLGYQMNGTTSGLCGIALLLFAIVKTGKQNRPYSILCTLLGTYLLCYLISEFGNLSVSAWIFHELGASLGFGLYISILGTVFLIIGGLIPYNYEWA